jgi:hypothetical protein
MTAKRIRWLFGTGWLATALSLPWLGVALPESPKSARLDVCSLEDGLKAAPRSDAAAVRFRSSSLSPAPAEMCPQQPAEDPSATAAPEDTPLAAPDVERPATVQNLRRADGR